MTMPHVVSLVMPESQSAFVADAVLLVATIVSGDQDGQKKMGKILADSLKNRVYDQEVIMEVVKKIDKIADHWLSEES